MLCSLFQFTISAATDSDRPLGRLTHWHVRRCDDCRRFHRSCRTLDTGLRSEAVAWSSTARHITDRILPTPPHVERLPPTRFVQLAMAVAACIIMAVAISWMNWREQPASPASSLYALATPQIELASVWTRVFEAPLTTEAQNLSNDAQSSIRFLVACLAVRPSESAAPQVGRPTPSSAR
jgi:hypothetical protein